MRTGVLLAIAAYAAWGLLSPVGKLLLEDLTPLWLNATRMVIATLVLVPIIGMARARAGLRLLRRPEILLLALVGNGVSFTFFIWSVERLPATYATLGFYTAPLWTAVLARWVLGEQIGGAFVPAVAALFIGAWFALGGGPGLSTVDPLGLAFAVGAAVTWAWFTILLRRHAPGVALRPLMMATFVAGTFYFVVMALVLEPLPDWGALPADAWPWLGLFVLVPSLGAQVLFNGALQRAPAAVVNVLVGVELAATAVFSAWLLGDRFTGSQLAGLVVVLAAVSAYLWTRGRASTKVVTQAAS